MKQDYSSIKGTQDVLPASAVVRENARAKILQAYKKNGFSLIETPCLENLDFLNGSDGGDNLRLIFKILKRGEKLDLDKENLTEEDICDCALRYDLTVPLVRFYCANKNDLPKPFKSIQIGNAFRAERPQKGRLRQFVQCDVDILADSSPNAEIEVILAGADALINLGFENFKFFYNDRRVLKQLILNAGFKQEETLSVCISLDKFDKIGESGVITELIQKGYAEGNCKKLIESLKIVDTNIKLSEKYGVDKSIIEEVEYVIYTLNNLSNNKFVVDFNPFIIRGQGYYTSSVFELYLDGFDGSCGGGGRYDNMAEKFCGEKTSAVGFSIGFERICYILEKKTQKNSENLLILIENEQNFLNAKKFANEKYPNKNCCIVLKAKNVKNQIDLFAKNGFPEFIYFK